MNPINFFNSLYARLASPRIILSTGIATIIMLGALAALDATCRPSGTKGIISLQLAFSDEAFGNIITSWGPEAVSLFRIALVADLFFPFAYALFLSGCIAGLTRKEGSNPRPAHLLLFVIPLDAGILDWIENALHISILAHPGNFSPTLVFIASAVASLKWFYVTVSISAVLYFFIKKIRHDGLNKKGQLP